MAAITELPNTPDEKSPSRTRDATDTDLKSRDEGFFGSLVGSILEVRSLRRKKRYEKLIQS